MEAHDEKIHEAFVIWFSALFWFLVDKIILPLYLRCLLLIVIADFVAKFTGFESPRRHASLCVWESFQAGLTGVFGRNSRSIDRVISQTGPQLNEWRRASWALEPIFLCPLTTDTVWTLAGRTWPLTMHSSYSGLYCQTVNKNRPFLDLLLLGIATYQQEKYEYTNGRVLISRHNQTVDPAGVEWDPGSETDIQWELVQNVTHFSLCHL